MSNRTREFAKFFAGFAAQETLGHWFLGIWGRDYFPIRLGGFEFTPQHNLFVMTGWMLVCMGLVYYAWLRKPALETGQVKTA